MGWSGGSYTKGNAGTGGWTGDASLGIGIEAGRHDTQDNDFATGINQCINKDGSNAFTGDPNLGGFKPTNIAAGTAAAPALCVGGDVNTGVFGPAADTWAVATNGTERVRVDSSGNVGIGTTNPGYVLDVQGLVTFSTPTTDLTNKTGRIIGRPSTNADGDFLAVDVRGISGANEVVIGGGSGLYRAITSFAVCTAANTTTNSGTERFRIRANGDVEITNRTGMNNPNPVYRLQLGDDSAAKPTTNTWIIASDERIKTNVQNYTKGLAEICQIRPITYDYNGKGGFAAGPGGISILAQEIQPIFPECVNSYKGKLNPEDEEETDILNYNGHAITFALINAVKELNAKVEALQTRVAELETA